jgi:hypothetical protein
MQFHAEAGYRLQMIEAEEQSEMATRKNRKSKTEPLSKQRKSKLADERTFPSEQERLPLHIPGAYQVAMGTGEEIVTWLRAVPGNDRAILIQFPNEASYRKYGPIFWYVATKLSEIVARIQRRRFERLVDELTALLLSRPGAVPKTVAGANGTPAKETPSRRSR